MKFFEKYVSNTTAGSGNQTFFTMEEGEIRTGRVFYKIFAGGKYNYSLLFSNITDSTFADGTKSRKNMLCEPWQIHSARIGKCKTFPKDKPISNITVSDYSDGDILVEEFAEITFDGKEKKTVNPGEFFSSDPVEIEFEKGEYLCLEMTFSGTMIPYHEESILPIYVKKGQAWEYSKLMPVAGMVGCDRSVKKRIAFWGDSITQGIGTEYNSYDHWNARLSEALGEECAYWNLGIGFARSCDAASGGAWFFKAKENDIVVICFGVNDILNKQDCTDEVKEGLLRLIEDLHNRGVKVVIQTVPPFDYVDEKIQIWENINTYIREVLAEKADAFFDNTVVLSDKNEPWKAPYGGHPGAEGCKLWAEAFYPVLKKVIEE